MKKQLEKIKKRPIAERKKIATIFAVILTLLVVIVSFILGSIFKTEEKIQTNNQPNSIEKMFNGMEEKFSEFSDEFKEQKDSVKNLTKEIVITEQIENKTREVLNTEEKNEPETVEN